ncbi:uncharacterized protein ARMOST_10187 [Armillaria ostoyae]|uniref:Uncharacterized protein n=1 Tax=Armillaria ostoyae TaxID=47428 RepID=A0A284RDR3_ARMOS|nr:uncharacterized protein ARMOST_10187 [Armillaria ostoyae]
MSMAVHHSQCPKDPCHPSMNTQVSSSVSALTLTPADLPQESNPPFVPTHRPRTPPPYENPKWDFPEGELQTLRQDTFSHPWLQL